jgi:hypothetical protein
MFAFIFISKIQRIQILSSFQGCLDQGIEYVDEQGRIILVYRNMLHRKEGNQLIGSVHSLYQHNNYSNDVRD